MKFRSHIECYISEEEFGLEVEAMAGFRVVWWRFRFSYMMSSCKVCKSCSY
jgi:hypothetical protein